MISTFAKPMLVICALLILSTLGIPSLGSSAAQTTPTPTVEASEADTVVEIELEGIVAFVDASNIILSDGTQIHVEDVPIPPEVVPGVYVRIVARFEDDDLFLLEIVVLTDGTPEPTVEPTVEPTAEPTLEPTSEPTVEPTSEPTLEPTAEVTAEPTMTADCPEALNDHPVGHRLADTFGVSYEEIMSWKCAGFGFGEIARAYALAAESGIPVADIFAMKTAGMGWGNIVKEIRRRAGGGEDAPSGVRIKARGARGSGSEDGKSDDGKQGGGNGKGKGKGNGNGQGNGKGKGKK